MGSRAESIIPVLGPGDAQWGDTSCAGVPFAPFPSQVAPPCGCPGVPTATPSTPGGPRSQGREGRPVPARPAGVSRRVRAGSSLSPSQAAWALAPPGAPPRAVRRCPRGGWGGMRCYGVLWDTMGCCGVGWGSRHCWWQPGLEAVSRRSPSPLQNPLPSHPHPPPRTSGKLQDAVKHFST